MKAVVTVIGKDSRGIIAAVSSECANLGGNIVDISQSVMREYFAMIMLVNIEGLSVSFATFADNMKKLGEQKGLEIHTMHEDIFNSMHRI